MRKTISCDNVDIINRFDEKKNYRNSFEDLLDEEEKGYESPFALRISQSKSVTKSQKRKQKKQEKITS